MILVMQPDTALTAIQQLLHRLNAMGFSAHHQQRGEENIIVIVEGIDKHTQTQLFTTLPNVAKVDKLTEPYKLTHQSLYHQRLSIHTDHFTLHQNALVIMAGPCSIESEQQIYRIAKAVKAAGATCLRGGAYKPRTSPYDFQGLGKDGIRYLHQAARHHQLPCVSEIMDIHQIQHATDYLDIIQIGARNMYNYTLLKELGQVKQPILLKRGLSATYKEFLLAAEYILNAGNPNVILCERGIRSYETHTRNTLDLNAVPVLQSLSHLPVIVDPSHGTGLRHMVPAMSCAAVAAGANGLMIETHYDPDNAYSDAQQTIHTTTLHDIIGQCQQIHAIVAEEHDNHSHAA